MRDVVNAYLLIPVALIALAPASYGAGDELVFARTNGPFCSRALVWSRDALTESNLRALYRQTALEMKAKRAWTVSVSIERDDAIRELYGKLTTEMDYDRWRR